MRPSRARKAAAFAVLVGGAGLLVGDRWRWGTLPSYAAERPIELAAPILSDEEYGRGIADHPRPFVVEIETARGALVLFGSEHTNDAADPQIAAIGEAFARLRPTVVLCDSPDHPLASRE